MCVQGNFVHGTTTTGSKKIAPVSKAEWIKLRQ